MTSLLDLDVEAGLRLTLGDDDASKIARAASGMVFPVSFFGDSRGNQTSRLDAASNVSFIRMHCYPRVPPNCWWEIRSWRMTKNGNPFTTGNETAYAFLGGAIDDYSSGSFIDVTSQPLPQTAFYSAGQVVGYPGYVIYFAITNFDTTATYQVTGSALQRPYGEDTLIATGV